MMFSVVIPYYDAEGTIGAQLDALASQRPPPGPWEVVVSDNESSDALKGLARTYSERLENLRSRRIRPAWTSARPECRRASCERRCNRIL